MNRNITKNEFNNLINKIYSYEKNNLIKKVSEANGLNNAKLYDLKYELDVIAAEQKHDSAISTFCYKDGNGFDIFPKIEVSTHNCLDFTISIQHSKTHFINFRTTLENLYKLHQQHNDFNSINLLNAAYQSFKWLQPKIGFTI